MKFDGFSLSKLAVGQLHISWYRQNLDITYRRNKNMVEIQTITTNSMSFYRTEHNFEHYGEFTNPEEFEDYCRWAKGNKINVYILGNGSNTLFTRKNVKTLILKNKLEKSIKPLTNNKFEISSSTLVIDVLKLCYKNSFDSFYYLSSVPATVGGALAMNAGRGWRHKSTIYDFVESVTFFDFTTNLTRTLKKEDIVKSYRSTIFTGLTPYLILKAVFNFETANLKNNPISERIQWSKNNQDYQSPNCGSVFKEYQPFLIKLVKGLKIKNAAFSKKTDNWILNFSSSSVGIVSLIKIVKFLHLITGKKAILEIIEVE